LCKFIRISVTVIIASTDVATVVVAVVIVVATVFNSTTTIIMVGSYNSTVATSAKPLPRTDQC
jgi:hypothetical protein